VIAININGLLAHSTVDYTLEQRYAQSVRHAYTEVAGAKDGVVPVLFDWDRPAEIDENTSQKKASFNFDLQMLQHLVSTAPNERERQRLLQVAQPHACGFLTGVPSEEDGNGTILFAPATSV